MKKIVIIKWILLALSVIGFLSTHLPINNPDIITGISIISWISWGTAIILMNIEFKRKYSKPGNN